MPQTNRYERLVEKCLSSRSILFRQERGTVTECGLTRLLNPSVEDICKYCIKDKDQYKCNYYIMQGDWEN